MKVRTLRNVEDLNAPGEIIGPGEEIDIPDNIAILWIDAGSVEEVEKKRRGRPPKSDNAVVEGADASE